MGRANLPNFSVITDQLRVDNHVVGGQSDSFLVGTDSVSQPETTPDESTHAPTKPDIFPFMRAYGCLGRKQNEEK